jgi:hypothetical protein
LTEGANVGRRYFVVEVERTVTYRRKVWVEVEETDERLKDMKGYPREKDEPLFKGAATVAMARKVYGIKTPDEFRETSLFDFGMSDANIKTGSSTTPA